MNQTSPLTSYLYKAHNWGVMASEIVSQANQFLQVISPELDENQVEYLSWRVCGFTKKESLAYSKLTLEHLEEWTEDPNFTTLERKAMGELQTKFANDVMILSKSKNARLISGIDSSVVQKAFLGGIESLTSKEFEWVKQIRTQFNPDVRRMLGEKEDGTLKVEIPKSFDEAMLLIRRSNSHVNDQGEAETAPSDFIEAEYTKSPELPSGEEAGTTKEDVT